MFRVHEVGVADIASDISLWTWLEPAPQSAERKPLVVFVALSADRLADDVKRSHHRFGLPYGRGDEEVAAALTLGYVSFVDVPVLASTLDKGEIGASARRTLAPADAARRADMRFAHFIIVSPKTCPPPDLAYLQVAWAYVHFFMARGASLVLDLLAGVWHGLATLPPARRAEFDPRSEITLEAAPRDLQGPGGTRLLHTRGMIKFGAPELAAFYTPADRSATVELLGTVASMLALGVDCSAAEPGRRIDIKLGMSVTLAAAPDAVQRAVAMSVESLFILSALASHTESHIARLGASGNLGVLLIDYTDAMASEDSRVRNVSDPESLSSDYYSSLSFSSDA